MDVELVVRAQRGDVEAFTALVDAMGGRLHAAAYSILRDREAAADATQRALIAAWQGLPGLRDPVAFPAWCYRMLIRSCHAEARRQPRWLPLELEPELVASAGFDPAMATAHRDQLERGFRRLSVEQRAVVVLRHLLDLPVADVAQALGVPQGTVNSRLSRAMDALRAALEADDRPPTPPAAPAPVQPRLETRS